MTPNNQFNNNRFYENYQLKLPLEMDVLIPEDDSVRLLNFVLEGLDYSNLYNKYSTKGRKSKVDPKIMFKIITYANMENIWSSRDIEKHCRRDINFKWLLQGVQPPDHSTICRFKYEKMDEDVLENLFSQMLNILFELGEINFENIFIDGTKIESAANKYTFVWRKTIIYHEKNMNINISELFEKINKIYNQNFTINSSENIYTINQINKVLNFLYETKISTNTNFVYGKGHKKTQLQKFTEGLEKYADRRKKYNEHYLKLGDRNSYSKTDIDATFMRMKEDYMKNGQLKPAYNLQIGVESEYIVSAAVFNNPTDSPTLIYFLEKLKQNLNTTYKNVIADAGYESEENYMYLKENSQNTYIKPSNYEQSKKRGYKLKYGKVENMIYDEENDRYICHNNKYLEYIKTISRKTATGYSISKKIYKCSNCKNCEFRSNCYTGKYSKKITVSPKFSELRKESLKNITSEKGNLLRINRSIQVEGAFGVIKNNYGFKRFLSKGTKNINIDILFLCLGYNINKLHSKIINNRLGISLFKENEVA